MIISDVIINDIALQPLSEKLSNLKKIFDELTYSHLPIAKDGIYLGCISENDVRCFEADKAVKDYQYALSPFFVRKNDSLLDMLKVFTKNSTKLIPVLEEETNTYLGYIEVIDILGILEQAPLFSEEGNIIVVEKGEKDYSFSEVCQIIESNEGKIYGCYINKFSDGIVQITLKINHSMMSEILQTFRRYDYKVISQHKDDNFIQSLKERSDYLNKYLNI